jgi:PST family polysaccharide transporter
LKTTGRTQQEKYHHFFDTEVLQKDLKNNSIRGGFSTMLAETVSFVLRMGSMIVLARILLPEHFGLVSMVTALTAFAERFMDFGLATAAVQRKEINHQQLSMLFWINAGTGAVIMLVMAVFSQAIAWFYNDPRIVSVTLALSSTFFFSGLTIQHQALLRRQMQYGSLAWIRIISTAMSIVLAIGFALQGYEHWALVWKEVARAAFIAAGTWLMCRWVPGLQVSRSGIASMLRFGRDITGFNIIHFFSRNLDQILIGRFWGAVPLGFYSKAYQLMSLPVSQLQFPVQFVAESTLSTLQSTPDKYRQYYQKIISLLSFSSMPLAVYLVIFSEEIIGFLLGETWIASAEIFRILAIAAFIQPVASTGGFVLVTSGKTKQYLWWGVLNGLSLVTAFSIGIYWGTTGIAAAFTINTYAILFPSLWMSFKNTPISIALFLRAIALAVFASITMGLLLVLIFQRLLQLDATVEIFISLISAFVLYCGIWLVFPEGKQKLVEYFSYPLTVFKRSSFLAKKIL